MESVANCGERATVSGRFERLTNAYRCLLAGSLPESSAVDLAGVIFSGVCGPVPGAPVDCYREDSAELTCISVSLVEKMTRMMSRTQQTEVTVHFAQVLGLLLQDMDVMSQLVRHFQAEDQMISHLAAKSASACVVYQLHNTGTICPVWQQKCVQAFHSSSPGTELDACLWSITEVLKRLKAAHPEFLGQLLAAFDSSLSALCSKFLPEDKQHSRHLTTSHGHWGTMFCLLLDLMEALTASTLICGTGLKSQRLTHLHSLALLTTISCSSEHFIKRRALLLLKRTVLQKAGEDWASGDRPSTGLKYELLSLDRNMLGQTVLTAVGANWLKSIQVESASYFGGQRHVRGGEGQKPDCMMLRGISLLLLKSVELHIQTSGGTAGAEGTVDVHGYLQSLWDFLRRSSIQLREVTHLCCWVSLLFGEQDDDMVEAAKALLSIFLHHRQCSGSDDIAVLEAACVSGCNPHCHFLLLLQSVSFDHSILLDFLISSETCFLEYFVQCLKFLRADWQGFIVACERVSMSDFSLQESPTCSLGAGAPTPMCKGEPGQVEFSFCGQPADVTPRVERIGSATGLRLVEYDSSDESDPESMEISEAESGASASEKSRYTALDVKQETSESPEFTRERQHESPVSAGLMSGLNSILEKRQEGFSLPVLQSKYVSCTNMSALSGQVTYEMLARVVHCLSELRVVVTRLQAKKLFPYNPSSLLKLLAQVENCFQQLHLSQFNK